MAYTKALFCLILGVVAALAAEEPVREKKQVFYGAAVAGLRDDGQWAPGKYEGLTYSRAAVVPGVVSAAVPGVVSAAVPAAYSAAVPAAYSAAVPAAYPAAYSYGAVPAYTGLVY